MPETRDRRDKPFLRYRDDTDIDDDGNAAIRDFFSSKKCQKNHEVTSAKVEDYDTLQIIEN